MKRYFVRRYVKDFGVHIIWDGCDVTVMNGDKVIEKHDRILTPIEATKKMSKIEENMHRTCLGMV